MRVALIRSPQEQNAGSELKRVLASALRTDPGGDLLFEPGDKPPVEAAISPDLYQVALSEAASLTRQWLRFERLRRRKQPVSVALSADDLDAWRSESPYHSALLALMLRRAALVVCLDDSAARSVEALTFHRANARVIGGAAPRDLCSPDYDAQSPTTGSASPEDSATTLLAGDLRSCWEDALDRWRAIQGK